MTGTKVWYRVLGIVFLILVVTASLNLAVWDSMAGKYYPRGYDKCIADSGGRGHIHSVANYACEKAIMADQNACASWLGPSTDSRSTMIVAAKASGSIDIRLWGMCTDYANTSSRMDFFDDGGSISCDGTCNFTRSGVWGSPSSKVAHLDVARFINGAKETITDRGKEYYRLVMVDRQHGGNSSSGLDFSPITLIITDEDPDIPPPPITDVCAAWGNPSSYDDSNENHGTTSIDIKIRNTDGRWGGIGTGDFGDWNDGAIYAMPTDKINWHTCYWPGVQTTTETEVSSVNERNWGNYNKLRTDICQNEDVTYKKLREVASPWGNDFELMGRADTRFVGAWPIGNTDVRDSDSNLEIAVGDVGLSFPETARTVRPVKAVITVINEVQKVENCPCCPNPPVQTCDDPDDADNDGDRKCSDVPCDETNTCYCCTNKYNSPLKDAKVSFDTIADSAEVRVPYNYINYTGVNIDSDIVYSGEMAQIEGVWVQVASRYNELTEANYATMVRDAKVQLIAYVSDKKSGEKGSYMSYSGDGCDEAGAGSKQCIELENEPRITLNPEGDLAGNITVKWGNKKYNAFDASAGDYICFVSAVYPATISWDGDMHTEGNKQWHYSEPSCRVIAKRPSFQIWGGDMYSNSVIEATPAQKRNVYNGYKGDIKGLFKSDYNSSGVAAIYGSWVEEGLMLGSTTGKTKDLASGATTGYNSDSKKAYAGANSGNFAEGRAPLTISNYVGGGWGVGASGVTLDPDNTERGELIRYWTGDGAVNDNRTTDGMAINFDGLSTDPDAIGVAVPSATEVNIRYVEPSGGGNLNISGTIPNHTTILIKAAGTVTIKDDVIYDGRYGAGSTLTEISKLVIYAKNVNIECKVKEVDAIIITMEEGKVKTCSDASTDIDEAKRSIRLRVFGAVMADEIELGRTYGQAAWSGSGNNGQGEAAEVFDFDSSIFLWSELMASSSETDTLQVVYQNEIAPRY